MDSIMDFKERGYYGNSKYRGNCSGFVIKNLIEHFFPRNAPRQFVEVFSGGGTGKDVANELGIKNSLHLDLNNGWNALIDDIPTMSDFTFSHPPYWDIIKYETQRKSFDKDDLSNEMPYDDFIKMLDLVNQKIYNNLVNHGRHAFLVGDVRKKGKYYSIIKDMTWFGDLESHIIKTQHNTVSGKKIYANSNFIPIAHEHLLIFKKNSVWQVPIKYTKDFVKDFLESTRITWKNLIYHVIQRLNNNATNQQIYDILVTSKKAATNNNLKAKIRQVLNEHGEFKKVNDSWVTI